MTHNERNPDKVWTGPLNVIMQKSYINGVFAGLAAGAFSYGLDQFLVSPKAAPRWPAYAAVMPQHRGYGWILFSLATFQYFVEDTEISSITDKNHRQFLEDLEDERLFIERMEKSNDSAKPAVKSSSNTV